MSKCANETLLWMTTLSADQILVQHHEIEGVLEYFGHVGRGGLALAISLL